MRRFILSLVVILMAVLAAILFDQWYIEDFKQEMNKGIDEIVSAEEFEDCRAAGRRLEEILDRRRLMIENLVFSNHLEEVEMLLSKLKAYIGEKDQSEIIATAEELRTRIELLRS